jgi:hypothetical protein
VNNKGACERKFGERKPAIMKDVYEIKPKPTYYNHILYRSRLEARWAAMFDFLRWDFEYEPEPFATWSPDFVIHTLDAYVEVKPMRMWEGAIEKMKPYSKEYRCGLLSDVVVVDSNAYYIGKYLNRDYKEGELILNDFTIQYRGNFTPKIIRQLWCEAQNKVMYLKPKQ